MKTDIQIAQEATMLPIKDVAASIGIEEDDLELYGKYKAKISDELINRTKKNPDGKLILVTAINPTPAGEGKTTTSVGLGEAFGRLGKKALIALREPSLGPCFGIKGGAAGGGYAQVVPMEDLNLHFTGDFHAITACNNLLAAAIYNHIYQGNELNIDENRISFKRCLDVNDRMLRGSFNITAASEIMAIFCLASDLNDLRRRLGNILCAYTKDDKVVLAKDLKIDGALTLLLEKAFYPNLVQTLEENPVLVHGGPFANIAHGCCSVTNLKLGLNLSNYVITEAGFGSDLGCEKYMNILARKMNLTPSYIVLVATIRALKHSGMENLDAHIDHLKQYHVPFCVAINKFSEDSNEELQEIIDYVSLKGVKCIVTDSYNEGSSGSISLAEEIINSNFDINSVSYLYEDSMTIQEKIEALAKKVYHASSIQYSDEALEKLEEIKRLNLEHYPICVAKTQYSISDDETKLGYPKDYTLNVRDIVIQTGSEMIIVLLNKIITMPGLPKHPNFENME